jgi:cytochrome c-type biogenesis protein CcmH/NrfF
MLWREANVVSKLGLPELLVIGIIFLLVAGPAAVVVAVVLIVQRSRKREEELARGRRLQSDTQREQDRRA